MVGPTLHLTMSFGMASIPDRSLLMLELAFLLGCAVMFIVGIVLSLRAQAILKRRADHLAPRPNWWFGEILVSWTASGANLWFLRAVGLALAVVAFGLFSLRLWVLADAP